MSFRHVPYSAKTTSSSTTPEQTGKNRDDDEFRHPSSISAASAGERAWGYLLRRRAEDINDRIHRTKAVEFNKDSAEELPQFYIPVYKIKKEKTLTEEEDVNCCSLPQETSGSPTYAPNEGFWIDRAGERCDEETCVRVKSEFDETRTSDAGTHHYESETSCGNKFKGYGKSVPTNQLSDEALMLNVSSYIKDARRATKNHGRNAPIGYPFDHDIEAFPCTWLNYRGNVSDETSIDKIPNDRKEKDHLKKDYYMNCTNETLDNNMSNDGQPHYREICNENTRLSDNLFPKGALNYTEDMHQVTRQTCGGKCPDQASTQGVPIDDEDLRHLIKNYPQRNFSSSHPADSAVVHDVSVKDMRSATQQRSEKSRPVRIGNRTLIHTLPYPAEGVEVVYTTDPVEADAWLRNNIIDCSTSAVGFDIEWKPQFVSKKQGGVENKTAVLQLGVENSCLVLHLHNMKTLPKYLVRILKNPLVLKIGSGILQDVSKLKKDTGLECIGLVDTQIIAAKSARLPESQNLGLKSLAKNLLGIQLEKPKSVSMSNWERFPLTIKQIHYAALDAWVGLKIYQHVKGMHGQTHHFQDKSISAEGDVASKPVKKISCHVCKKKVKDSNALVQHLRIHAKCECGEYFMAKISKSHKKECPVLNSEYSSTPVDDTLKEPGWCQGCGKKCKTVQKLMEHIRDVCHVLCPFCTRLLPSTASSSHISKCKNYVSEWWKQLAK